MTGDVGLMYLDSAVTAFLPGLDKQDADSVKLRKVRQAIMYRNKPVVRRKACWSLCQTILGINTKRF